MADTIYVEMAKVDTTTHTAEVTTPDSAENLTRRVSQGFLVAQHEHIQQIPNGKVEVEDYWDIENGYAVCHYKLADAPSPHFELPDGTKIIVETNSLGEKTLRAE